VIPYRIIRSGVLLAGLLAAMAIAAPASTGFTGKLTVEQKTETGLDTLTANELTALDHLVAADVARGRHTPSLADPYSQRYGETDAKEAGLDRLTQEQLAKLDGLIATAVAAAPAPRLQPRERPRLRGDDVLSDQRRLQVHGGFSLTYGSAGGGRNFHETGAWVSYFDPVTGIGLSFAYSRYSGDMFGSYYGNSYDANLSYVYPPTRASNVGFEREPFARDEFMGNAAPLEGPVLLQSPRRGFRR